MITRYFGQHTDAPDWAVVVVQKISPLVQCEEGVALDWHYNAGDKTIVAWHPCCSENGVDFDIPEISPIRVSDIIDAFGPDNCGDVVLDDGVLTITGVYDGHTFTFDLAFSLHRFNIDGLGETWSWLKPVLENIKALLLDEGKNKSLLN